jgi:hypothetical protein
MVQPVCNRSAAGAAPDWHDTFLAMLPKITAYARVAFRSLLEEARDEALQDAIANALAAYVRLVQLNKIEYAYPTVLARYAIGHVWDGRTVGASQSSRDVLSPHARRKKRFAVGRLGHFDDECQWREAVVEDRRTPVPDQVAFRIDFPTWLTILSGRDRQIAENLAIGQSTGEVAQQFGLSSARISQKRQELHASWQIFHGETVAATS